VGGIEQWVTIRGADRRNPILLVLHGGPAEVQSEFAKEYEPFEHDFVVVQWDQRGAGRTFMRAGAAAQPTSVDLLVDDAIDLTRTLTKLLPSKEVVLLGHSWGSFLGVLVVKKRPDLYRAYVGTGQVVSWDRAAEAQYRYTLARARAEHDGEAVRELEKQGPPPPGDFKRYGAMRKYLFPRIAAVDRSWIETMGQLVRARLAGAPDVWKGYAGGYDNTMKGVGGAITSTNLPALGLDFKVPFFVIQGRDDWFTPTALVTEYVEGVRAPAKRLTVIDGAGHFAIMTHTAQFVAALRADLELARR
jgi:pimeloyl-ACP methyl ester carboxylesterase